MSLKQWFSIELFRCYDHGETGVAFLCCDVNNILKINDFSHRRLMIKVWEMRGRKGGGRGEREEGGEWWGRGGDGGEDGEGSGRDGGEDGRCGGWGKMEEVVGRWRMRSLAM